MRWDTVNYVPDPQRRRVGVDSDMEKLTQEIIETQGMGTSKLIKDCDVMNTCTRLSGNLNQVGFSMGQRNNFNGTFYAWNKGPNIHTCTSCEKTYDAREHFLAGQKLPVKGQRCKTKLDDGSVCDGVLDVKDDMSPSQRNRIEIALLTQQAKKNKAARLARAS